MLIVKNDTKTLQYHDSFKEQFDKENKEYFEVDDNSELAQKILSAHEYELVLGTKTIIDTEIYTELEDYIKETIENPETVEVIDINIVKSYEQYLLEHPKPPTPFEKAKGKYNAADKASLNHMDIVKRIEILEELLMLKEG